jgi:membrane protein implicated in regulation of membrane protease activity
MGVWVVFAFYLLSAGWTLLSFALIWSGTITLGHAQREYFAKLGFLDYLTSLGVACLSIAAALLLFRLRRAAVPRDIGNSCGSSLRRMTS